MRLKWGPHLPPTSETVQCRREKKKGRESFSFHVCLTRLPFQAALTLMETQMWKRSSCWLLSGVIKKGLGHTERGPGGPLAQLGEISTLQ